MTKKRKAKKPETKGVRVSAPYFEPNRHLGYGTDPIIMCDAHGKAWRIDPMTGTATEIKLG